MERIKGKEARLSSNSNNEIICEVSQQDSAGGHGPGARTALFEASLAHRFAGNLGQVT